VPASWGGGGAWHWPATQGCPLHERPHAPQWLGSFVRLVSQPALALQSPKPVAQAMPHEVPLHVAVAFGPPGHGVHEAPHVAGSLLLAHPVPQAWKPAAQLKPHRPPLQVAVALGTAGQGVHEVPHVAGSLLFAQDAPHAWNPVEHAKPH
jgi:hypothetical protein